MLLSKSGNDCGKKEYEGGGPEDGEKRRAEEMKDENEIRTRREEKWKEEKTAADKE
jgi:hypothetical protein